MANVTNSYIDDCIEEISADFSFIAAGPIMTKIRAWADVLAKLDIPVLILGERGCGKELAAQLIHKLSARSVHPFITVNCATLPEDFLRGKLFGYAPGVFGDDKSTHIGIFELCDKGTILLDHVTEMPPRLQLELLQVLKKREFSRFGADDTVRLNARILASTDTNVDNILAERKLHEELYYQLSACTVQIPPLRHRREEIPLLLDYFMQRAARRSALSPQRFSTEMLESCQNYPWPGNFQELEKFVTRYLIAATDGPAILDRNEENRPKIVRREAPLGIFESAISGFGNKSLLQSVRGEAERSAIASVLEQTSWNRRAAARLLRISYRTLLYKIEQYSINDPKCSSPFPRSSA